MSMEKLTGGGSGGFHHDRRGGRHCLDVRCRQGWRCPGVGPKVRHSVHSHLWLVQGPVHSKEEGRMVCARDLWAVCQWLCGVCARSCRVLLHMLLVFHDRTMFFYVL
jgi:hypothetical protein